MDTRKRHRAATLAAMTSTHNHTQMVVPSKSVSRREAVA
jgi:hypothetical protein